MEGFGYFFFCSMDDVVWSNGDAQRLKKLRLESGMNVPELSKQSAVSAAQITQLEEGGDSLFYTPMIKYSVGKRLTLLLLQSKGEALGSRPLIDEKIPTSALLFSKELKAIEEMSRRNLDAKPISDALFWIKHQTLNFFQSKYVLASVAMLLTMAGISLYEKLDDESSTSLRISQAWFSENSAIDETLQKAKAALSSNSDSQFLSKSQEESQLVTERGTIAHTEELVHPVVGSKSSLAPASASDAVSPVLEPIFNLQGTKAQLSLELENWCRADTEETPLTSVSNSKPANYIYLVAIKSGTICVKDGKNRITWLDLQLGQAQTLVGAAPWKLKAQDWSAFQLFFQGRRIPLPSNEIHQLALFEATKASLEAFAQSQASTTIAGRP